MTNDVELFLYIGLCFWDYKGMAALALLSSGQIVSLDDAAVVAKPTDTWPRDRCGRAQLVLLPSLADFLHLGADL